MLAQSSHTRYSIAKAVEDLPFRITRIASAVSATELQSMEAVDIWILVETDLSQDFLGTLPADPGVILSLRQPVPSVIDLHFEQWMQELERQLAEAAKAFERRRFHRHARYVWLLAASTGGVKAVMEFLQGLDSPLEKTGFLYAQHIDAGQEKQIVSAINNSTVLKAAMATTGDYVLPGRVTVISPRQRTQIMKDGHFLVTEKAWNGLYKPSIDHLAADVSRCYGPRGNMIVFTGMGDDGAKGSRFIAKAGGQIWVQEPKTCLVSSMPDRVIESGPIHYCGSPAKIANKLEQYTAAGWRRKAV